MTFIYRIMGFKASLKILPRAVQSESARSLKIIVFPFMEKKKTTSIRLY